MENSEAMSKTNIQIKPYYSSLTDSYTKSILNSGLLLDEDLEVLLSFLRPYQTPHFKHKPTFKLPACLFGILASIFLAKKLDSKLLLVPPFLITTLSVTSAIIGFRCRRKQEKIIDDLIDILNKIGKVNSQVTAYTKARQELKPDESTHHLKKIEEFFEALAEIQQKQSQVSINTLYELGSVTKYLTDDLECLKSIELPNSSSLGNNSIEACLSYSRWVQDIHIWITSKLLSYIGIVFNMASEESTKPLLRATLPHLLNTLANHYQETKKQFDQLRESVRSWSEYKSQRKRTSKKLVSSKIETAIASVVDNLSLISEKSIVILNRLDSNSGEPKELNASLLDLRQQTYATYESLDLLCKLYGILTVPKDIVTKIEGSSEPARECESGLAIPSVRYDDQTEALEEHFDLFIDKDDAEESASPRRYSEGSSGAYVGLLLQELKQSLQQHERFVQAKQRRGSIEEEKNIAEEVVPMFNMGELRCGGREDLECVEVHNGVEMSLSPPVPPPLPPKLFDLSQVEEDTGYGLDKKSMMEGIKILSGQLSGNEEVFS